MKKVWINDNLEFVDCDEKFLQLVEDNMGKNSREYIEDNFLQLNKKSNALMDILSELKDIVSDLEYLTND